MAENPKPLNIESIDIDLEAACAKSTQTRISDERKASLKQLLLMILAWFILRWILDIIWYNAALAFPDNVDYPGLRSEDDPSPYTPAELNSLFSDLYIYYDNYMSYIH